MSPAASRRNISANRSVGVVVGAPVFRDDELRSRAEPQRVSRFSEETSIDAQARVLVGVSGFETESRGPAP